MESNLSPSLDHSWAGWVHHSLNAWWCITREMTRNGQRHGNAHADLPSRAAHDHLLPAIPPLALSLPLLHMLIVSLSFSSFFTISFRSASHIDRSLRSPAAPVIRRLRLRTRPTATNDAPILPHHYTAPHSPTHNTISPHHTTNNNIAITEKQRAPPTYTKFP